MAQITEKQKTIIGLCKQVDGYVDRIAQIVMSSPKTVQMVLGGLARTEGTKYRYRPELVEEIWSRATEIAKERQAELSDVEL